MNHELCPDRSPESPDHALASTEDAPQSTDSPEVTEDALVSTESPQSTDPAVPPETTVPGATETDEVSPADRPAAQNDAAVAAQNDDHAGTARTSTSKTPLSGLPVASAYPQAVRQNARKAPRSVLLTIACLGEVTLDHIRRLEFPDKHDKTRQRAMQALTQHDPPLIQARRRYAHDDVRNIPIPLPEVYALSAAGHERIRMDPQYPLKTRTDQYPAKPTAPRVERLLEHDLLATHAIVRLIELARPHGLSGVFVARELRLDPTKPAPIMDALLVLHVNGDPCRPNTVPWTKDGRATSEHSWRIAIESDRNTEPISTIQAKARNYRDVCADPEWHAQWQSRFGPFPLPLWLVLHERRLQAVNRCWHAEWPEGHWLLATEAMIARNEWMYHEAHVEQLATVTMFMPGVAGLGAMQRQQVEAAPAPARLAAAPPAPPAPTPEASTPPAPAATPPHPTPSAPRVERASRETPPAPLPVRTTEAVRRPRIVIRAADLPRSHTLTSSEDRAGDQLRAVAEPARRTGMRLVVDWGMDLMVAAFQVPAGVRAWWREQDAEHPGLFLSVLMLGIVVSLLWLWEPLRDEASRAYTYGTQLAARYLLEPRPPAARSPTLPTAPAPAAPSCGRVQVHAAGVRERLTPGLHGQIYRRLAAGEHLLVRCESHQVVDGLDWTPVEGDHDVLPGWVATRYLVQVSP